MTIPLPPPPIFTHKETIHAIELPPLAQFLASLSIPDQLLKLNDILLRYRTPKSYHRVDVREVTSSELPLSSPEPEGNGDEGLKRKREREEEKGDPILLEEGDTVEEYKARKQGEGNIIDKGETNGSTQPDQFSTVDKNDQDTISTIVDPSNISAIEPTPTLLTSSLPQARSPTPPTSVKSLSPTKRKASEVEATHHLPPSGPKRRVRELRLDLRTLDAAALFALEIWRREVMGLEKLEMEHPDSIWYKDDSPEPEPEPEPELEKRKVGRPRKAGKSASRTPAAETVGGEEGVVEGDPEENVAVNGTEVEVQEAQATEITQDIDAFDELVDGSTDLKTTEPTMIATEADPVATEPIAPKSAGPAESTPPPSPDILLVDGFNRKEHDSDFSPESSVSPVRRRRARLSKAAMDNATKVTPKQAFQEASPPQVPGTTSRTARDIESTFGPASSAKKRRGRPSRNEAALPLFIPDQEFQEATSPEVFGFPQEIPDDAELAPATTYSPTKRRGRLSGPSTSNTARLTASQAFQPAAAPEQLGSSSRGRKSVKGHFTALDLSDDDDADDVPLRLPQARTREIPMRRISISPEKQSAPSRQHPIVGVPAVEGTLDDPYIIPDSPERPAPVQVEASSTGFVPFHREEMRMPTFNKTPAVPPKRGLHWHINYTDEPDRNTSSGKKRKAREIGEQTARPQARKRPSLAKVHYVEQDNEEEEGEEELEDHAAMEVDSDEVSEELEPARQDLDGDDEWADFRF